ncbi:hypothetical protein M9H77_16111 [Catharanthus roseus]|uniref:Uncharacterized protein n=1 Tax=Catharanthus roseus TaxID=4058 RepID=A0ACC0B0Z0_CATRO|nr:hypothetical protein M9H77_16111 [Catharanthus roseus]
MLSIQLDDIKAFFRTLEIDGPISIAREMHRLAKGVLSLVLPENPSMTLTSSLKVTATKGRRKTNSIKRDKSYWEHVSIAHRKIQKSNGSGLGSGSGSGLVSRARGRTPAPRSKGKGFSSRRSSLSSVVDPSPCSTFPYTDAFPCFVYPFIENWKNMNDDGNCGYRVVADFVFGDEHQWHENNNILLSYKCEMDVHWSLYTCSRNISTAGQRLILTRLQIGIRESSASSRSTSRAIMSKRTLSDMEAVVGSWVPQVHWSMSPFADVMVPLATTMQVSHAMRIPKRPVSNRACTESTVPHQ